jgi:hypothetical protein
MRTRDQNGEGWADIIDFLIIDVLTMKPDARQQVVRVLGEIGAQDDWQHEWQQPA